MTPSIFRKVVLSNAELAVLEKEDKVLAPAPNVLGAGNHSVKQPGEQPVSDQPLSVSRDAAKDANLPPGDEPGQARANYSAAEAAQAGTAGYTIYYLAAGVMAMLLSGTAYALKRCGRWIASFKWSWVFRQNKKRCPSGTPRGKNATFSF
jgi:hypothetical protein